MKKRRQKSGVPLLRAKSREQLLDHARSLLMRTNRTDCMLLQLLLSPKESLEPLGPLAGPIAKPEAIDESSS